MKYGLWFLSAAAIGAVGTVLAASLPVPPPLPKMTTRPAPAAATQVAAVPTVPAPAEPAPPSPAALPSQDVVTPPPVAALPVAPRPKRVTAAAAAPHSAAPSTTTKRPTRHLAKATPDRHPRAVAHAAAKPPPYQATVRDRAHIAMAPPRYIMPPPYWRMPYPPDY